jgi:hypothetical protein
MLARVRLLTPGGSPEGVKNEDDTCMVGKLRCRREAITTHRNIDHAEEFILDTMHNVWLESRVVIR